jgi:hypothetical protein
MTHKYSVGEADPTAQAAVIASLWVSNLVGHDAASAETKLRLGYMNNPAGPGAVVLLQSDGATEAHGALGLHPRRFHLASREIDAIGLADYAVNASHRSLGPALMLMRRGVQIGVERFELTYGFPNAKAAPVFARAGLIRLGKVQRYAKLLATREHLGQLTPPWVARCCAPIADWGIRVSDSIRSARAHTRLNCAPVAWGDAAFDALWQRRPAHLLLSQRSSQMLDWRFGITGRGLWQACLARDGHGAVQGYVVWRDNRGFAEIGDFFTVEPDRLTTPLMLAFGQLARQAGMRSMSVEFFGSPTVERQLLGSGMVLRPEQIPVYTAANAPADLRTPQAWYLTRFDNDAD